MLNLRRLSLKRRCSLYLQRISNCQVRAGMEQCTYSHRPEMYSKASAKSCTLASPLLIRCKRCVLRVKERCCSICLKT